MKKPDAINIIFIASTPEKVWAALTDTALSKSYFFGNSVELDAEVGGRFVVRQPDGSIAVDGKVLALEKARLLRIEWNVVSVAELKDKPPAIIEYRVESVGEAVKLSVCEFHTWDVPEKFKEAGRNGWALILSGVKSILETGKPLPTVKMEPPK
ncbi:SRPBCC domain-containing protein [Terrarubrum flagellatum]|uniref:SRPBCC domain-containing protein n=1 Tax=Terrirubrum flagellatum TaxID=2895980 RepID=UPI0031456347